MSPPTEARTFHAPLPLLQSIAPHNWLAISLLRRRNGPRLQPETNHSTTSITDTIEPCRVAPFTRRLAMQPRSKPQPHHPRELSGTQLNLIGTAKDMTYRTSPLVPTARRPIDPSRPPIHPAQRLGNPAQPARQSDSQHAGTWPECQKGLR